MAVLCVLLALMLAPARERAVIARLAGELVAAYVLAGIVCSPLLYYSLKGPQVQGYLASSRVADLLSFAIPTPLVAIGSGSFLSVAQMRAFLRSHRVGAVVAVPGQAGPWPRVLAQLGMARVDVGGVWLYRVRS